jgi:hypothetical protein
VRHRHPSRSRLKCRDIPSASGIGVCLQPISHGDDLHPAGFIIGHDVAGEPFRCESGLTIDDVHFPHKWSMTGSLAKGDLTIDPSIACTTHPSFHAFVQQARWTG